MQLQLHYFFPSAGFYPGTFFSLQLSFILVLFSPFSCVLSWYFFLPSVEFYPGTFFSLQLCFIFILFFLMFSTKFKGIALTFVFPSVLWFAYCFFTKINYFPVVCFLPFTTERSNFKRGFATPLSYDWKE